MANDGTVLFADICKSTQLTELVGDSEARLLIAGVLDDLTAITEAVGGRLIKTIGDEIMSMFSHPEMGLRAAADMQRVVTGRAPVRDITMRVRIGLHHGPILVEGDDLFGDVVNVAARVVALSAADQVLTTHDVVSCVDGSELPYRSLGTHHVRGRDGPLSLYEFLWRSDTTSLTAVAPRPEGPQVRNLLCRVGEKMIVVRSDRPEPITLGRDGECDFLLLGTSVSRLHAKIYQRGGLYFLEDQSTNGTFVKPETSEEVFVHREKVLLQGAGKIRLGESATLADGGTAIEYRTVLET